MSEPRTAQQRVRIYRAVNAPEVDNEIMPQVGLNETDRDGIAKAVEAGVGEGAFVRLVFADPALGISLTYAWLKQGYPLPRHSHNADCAYYVISGEAHFGTEVLKAGDGFFVPAGTLYQYSAGPAGVEVMEFRTAESFHIAFSGNKDSFWSRMARISAGNLDAWRNGPQPEAVRRFLGAA
jgi:quercetin dioxygenase-like cupin family protein